MLDIAVKQSNNRDIAVLTLSGEFDLSEKERVLSYLPQIITTKPKGLVVDLTSISFLDSAGVEVLITFYNELEEIGARTALVIDHNNYLLQKFKNLGVFDVSGLEIFETVEEAETTLVKA